MISKMFSEYNFFRNNTTNANDTSNASNKEESGNDETALDA